MKYPKLREIKEAIKALIKGPATTKYPFEPHIPPESFRGRPDPSQEGCIGCGACVEVCPTGAIKLKDELKTELTSQGSVEIVSGVRYLVWFYDECIFCAQCARNCTTRNEKIPGVVMSKDFELATTNRETLKSEEIKHELILCSYCRSVISTKSHFLYIIQKLGHKSFGNINLLQVINEKLNFPFKEKKFFQFYQRENLYEILCPKCRRRIFLFDEYGYLLKSK
ncbi:MAG: 4Fe-4S binding protein [Elusimicrobiota bacterium]|nr:4Fe-4S binding protein [Endomicrobiia bacterium]MCX7910702.1 4Fe-4S binding protein [Endomicrobiia bacterium]MDW8164911.1 4Fe-4S binding protein [Elusimicrobiota bacterium]